MTQQLSYAIYDTWDAWRGRASITGIAMMPLAGPPPQYSVPVVLDGGSEIEWLACVAGRVGCPPVFPAPQTANPNRIFLGGYQTVGFPTEIIGGYKMYRIVGLYWWGILNPEGLDSEFMLGASPLPNDPQYTTESIPAQYFQQNILNPNTAAKPSLFTGNNEQPNQLLRQVTSNPGW